MALIIFLMHFAAFVEIAWFCKYYVYIYIFNYFFPVQKENTKCYLLYNNSNNEITYMEYLNFIKTIYSKLMFKHDNSTSISYIYIYK